MCPVIHAVLREQLIPTLYTQPHPINYFTDTQCIQQQQSPLNNHKHTETETQFAISKSSKSLFGESDSQASLLSQNLVSSELSLDYMNDEPAPEAESTTVKWTTMKPLAKPSTMSSLAAAHILHKLFQVISTTAAPGSKVTFAQMAKHNLATSKPFIAASLRQSIKQLTQELPKPQTTSRAAEEDSEYYDSEYDTNELENVLDKHDLKDNKLSMNSTVVTTKSTTTTLSSVESTTKPMSMSAIAMDPLETSSSVPVPAVANATVFKSNDKDYSENYVDSDYANDEPMEEPQETTAKPDLNAQKQTLIQLLKQKLIQAANTVTPAPLSTSTTKTTNLLANEIASNSKDLSVPKSLLMSLLRQKLSRTSTTSAPLSSSTSAGTTARTTTTKSLNAIASNSEYYDDEDYEYVNDAEDTDRATGAATEAAIKQTALRAATAKRHSIHPSLNEANGLTSEAKKQQSSETFAFKPQSVPLPVPAFLKQSAKQFNEISKHKSKNQNFLDSNSIVKAKTATTVATSNARTTQPTKRQEIKDNSTQQLKSNSTTVKPKTTTTSTNTRNTQPKAAVATRQEQLTLRENAAQQLKTINRLSPTIATSTTRNTTTSTAADTRQEMFTLKENSTQPLTLNNNPKAATTTTTSTTESIPKENSRNTRQETLQTLQSLSQVKDTVATTRTTQQPKVVTAASTHQEILTVNKKPWLLQSKNQSIHLMPLQAASNSNPVTHTNRSSLLEYTTAGYYTSEKVPELILKVYEPIDVKVVFCPRNCDEEHDHKYGKHLTTIYYALHI